MQTASFCVSSTNELYSQLEQYPVHSGCEYLVQIFSDCNQQQAEKFALKIKQLMPQAVIVGARSSKTIHLNRSIGDSALVIITEFKKTKLHGVVSVISSDLRLSSKKLVEQFAPSNNPKAIVAFADGINSRNFELFSEINNQYPNSKIAGGVSERIEGDGWVLLNTSTYHDSIVAVTLSGQQLQVLSNCFSEWNPIGRSFTVTRASEKQVISIEGRSPLELYQQYLAHDQAVSLEDLRNFPLMKVSSPDQNVCIPATISDDGSMNFSDKLEMGDQVRFCYDHPSFTINQVHADVQTIRNFQPQSLLFYNCYSRLNFMQEDEELELFDSLEIKGHGTYCAGEFFHSEKQHKIMHHSFTYLALSEEEVKQDVLSKTTNVTPLERNFTQNFSPLFSLLKNALDDVEDLQKQMTAKLEDQSRSLLHHYMTDHRTQLPNRTALKEKLYNLAKNEYLLSFKVTNFSHVNEKYGYAMGDQLLKELSDHFHSLLIKFKDYKGALYSLNVAEWAAVFSTASKPKHTEKVIAELVDTTEKINFKPAGLPEMDFLTVEIKAGLVYHEDFPDCSVDELLIKSIEARRYAAKSHKFLINARDLRSQETKRHSEFGCLTSVSRALQQQNVRSYAQAIVDAQSLQPAFYECLVRVEENSSILTPGQFLPIIEGTHLYVRLSHEMIKETFRGMRHREEDFSLNLSPQDLLSERTIYLLEDEVNRLSDPIRFGIEVLETEQIQDYGRMREVCDHFRSKGVRIIVDDFGSGYSNIDEIIKLEPHTIKLDGSLVRNIDQDPKQRAITQQLVSLCKVFNAKTVAEFVHNQEVAQIAKDMGFDYLQGFYFSQPQPIAQISPRVVVNSLRTVAS